MTSPKPLISILTGRRRPKALVLGDLMLDRYVWGVTERISPEAPVPVVRAAGEEVRVGGAGNVAANLAALGARVTAVGVVGPDPEGATLRARLRQAGITAGGVRTEPGRTTTLKTRIIAHQQQLLRVDREQETPLGAPTERSVIAYLQKAVARCDVMVISDYDKGFLTPRLLSAAIGAARQAGIPVVVDPKQRDFALYAGATLVKPNLSEFARAAGGAVGDDKTMAAAGARLLKRHRLGALVVTCGPDGMALFEPGRKMQKFATARREAYDVTGAGDTACAAISYALATGHDPAEAVQLANVAASVAVSRLGAVPVGREELLGQLEDMGHLLSQKIKTVAALKPLLAACRARQDKIAFTNGCFDLLHVGHIGLLKYARRQADLLVVGINSDASIKRLKGAGRPILSEEERMQILAAIEGVDYIVVFDEESVLPLVKKLRPDIIVKGADYAKSEIVGQAFVESYGGTVRRAPLVRGVSTTDIVKKIRGGGS